MKRLPLREPSIDEVRVVLLLTERRLDPLLGRPYRPGELPAHHVHAVAKVGVYVALLTAFELQQAGVDFDKLPPPDGEEGTRRVLDYCRARVARADADGNN